MGLKILTSLLLIVASPLIAAKFQTVFTPHNFSSHLTKRELQKIHGWSADIDVWKPPRFLSQECPYYHAGYDYEGRPVMIAEFGKWNGKNYEAAGNETFRLFEKYIEKFIWRTAHLQPIDPEADDGVTLLFDMAGFDNSQLSSPVLVASMLKFGHYSALVEHRIAEFLAINSSHAFIIFQNLVRSVSGRVIGRLESFGNKPQVWKRILLNKIPPEQLPPWYGGKKSFKPIKVYI